MLKCIARIDWGRVPYGVFITLTYPDDHESPDHNLRTYHRSRFLRELEHHLGREVSVLWRSEFQKRKSGKRKGQIRPHFHLMCLGVRFVAADAVRRWWRGILDCQGPLATDVRGVSGAEGCGRYLAKYISKTSSLDNAAYLNNRWMVGRSWGLTRQSLVPWAPVVKDHEVTEEEYNLALSVWQQMWDTQFMPMQESFTILGKMRKDLFLRLLTERGCHIAPERL
jgi:hypothetical protein